MTITLGCATLGEFLILPVPQKRKLIFSSNTTGKVRERSVSELTRSFFPLSERQPTILPTSCLSRKKPHENGSSAGMRPAWRLCFQTTMGTRMLQSSRMDSGKRLPECSNKFPLTTGFPGSSGMFPRFGSTSPPTSMWSTNRPVHITFSSVSTTSPSSYRRPLTSAETRTPWRNASKKSVQ